MPKPILQFAKDSFLFQKKHIETQYSRFSDSQLEQELDKYRQFSIKYAKSKQPDKQNLNILVEGSSYRPDENFLKQMALYVHQVVINDPVFGFTVPRKAFTQAMNQYLGMRKSGLDREGLAKATQYINSMNKAIRAGYMDFLPLTFLHEPPDEIPMRYSEELFADVLPAEILELFQRNAKVVPLRKGDGFWYTDNQSTLSPCRAIDISFDAKSLRSYPYMLFQTEILSWDDETRRITFAQTMPDTPPSDSDFANWVYQSINQASRRFYDEVFKEFTIATSIGSSYLTQSHFVYQLLQCSAYAPPNLKMDVLNLAMELALPLLDNVSLDRVLDIRQKDGEVFENFRIELERQLKELRTIANPAELRVQLENVAHELSDVQIREIENKISSIKRGMLPDALILVGGLAAIIQSDGFGIPAIVYAIQNGYKTYQEYIAGIKEKPAYLLWKIRNK